MIDRVRLGPDASGLLIVYLVLLLLVPSSLRVPLLGGAGRPAALFALGLGALWACSRALPEATRDRFQPLHLMLGLFGGAGLLAFAVGAMRPLLGIESRGADRAVLAIAGLIGMTLVVMDGIRDRATLDRVIRAMVVVATVLAVLALIQFTTGADPAAAVRIPGLESAYPEGSFISYRSEYRRVAATTAHPIELGVLLAAVLPLALHRAMYIARDRRVRAWAAVFIIAVAIPMTVSRSAFVVLVVGAIVIAIGLTPRQRMSAAVTAVIYAVLMKLAVPGLLGTIKSLFLNSGTDDSVAGRTQDYGEIGRLLEGHLLAGRGLGTFRPESYFILDNQYIGSLMETGLIGLIVLIALLFTAVSTAGAAKRVAMTRQHAELGRVLMASLLGLIVAFGTYDALGFEMTAGLTFFMMGLAGAAYRIGRAERDAAEAVDQPTDPAHLMAGTA